MVNDAQGGSRQRRDARAADGMDGDAARSRRSSSRARTNRRRCGSRSGRRRTRRAGEYHASRASCRRGGPDVRRAGIQVIEYPHIRRQHIYDAADATLKVIDVKTAPNLTVGYIMGVGDEVPAAIEQLGVKVEMIDAGGSGVGRSVAVHDHRHRRARLRAARRSARQQQPAARLRPERRHAHRPVQQVRVQRGAVRAVPAQGQRRPRHRRVRAGRRRSTPAIRCSTTPNKITDAAWKGWVQERGLYFLGERDPRYRDLVALEDPFPYNKGEKRGALVRAAVRQRTLGLRRARPVARAAGRRRRRLSAAGEPDQSGQGA